MLQRINPWAVVSIALIIFIGGYVYSMQKPVQNPSAGEQVHTPPVPTPGRTFMVHSSDWEFMPSTIRVKQGEDASLHLMGIEGDHGIAIPGLGISETMAQGEIGRAHV